jgi:hypothetical protein
MSLAEVRTVHYANVFQILVSSIQLPPLISTRNAANQIGAELFDLFLRKTSRSA